MFGNVGRPETGKNVGGGRVATEDNASGGAAADEVVPVAGSVAAVGGGAAADEVVPAAGSVAAVGGVGATDDSGHPVTLDVEGAPACAMKALSVVTSWLICLSSASMRAACRLDNAAPAAAVGEGADTAGGVAPPCGGVPGMAAEFGGSDRVH